MENNADTSIMIAEVLDSKTDCLTSARAAMECEADAIKRAARRLDGTVSKAVEMILASQGKVLVSGLGKSGLVGQKIAATLTSTGTQAFFLHPSEALHGDLGVYSPGDVSILISNSGATSFVRVPISSRSLSQSSLVILYVSNANWRTILMAAAASSSTKTSAQRPAR